MGEKSHAAVCLCFVCFPLMWNLCVILLVPVARVFEDWSGMICNQADWHFLRVCICFHPSSLMLCNQLRNLMRSMCICLTIVTYPKWVLAWPYCQGRAPFPFLVPLLDGWEQAWLLFRIFKSFLCSWKVMSKGHVKYLFEKLLLI